MTRIKICGITSEREIRILNEYLPEYAGFVFAESRRRVTADMVKSFSGLLNKSILKAGIFVDEEIIEIEKTVRKAGLKVVQLHGSENTEYIRNLRKVLEPGVEIWKAYKVSTRDTDSQMFFDENIKTCVNSNKEEILKNMKNISVDRYLLDAFVIGSHGGTGRSFDWNIFKSTGDNNNMVLAGGLKPSNVKEAISIIRPYAVDVSSGVETNGVKDARLISDFIKNVRGQGYVDD